MRKIIIGLLVCVMVVACAPAVAREQPPQSSFGAQVLPQSELRLPAKDGGFALTGPAEDAGFSINLQVETATPQPTPEPWIPYEYVQRYQGNSDELLWAIILTLQASGVNMDRIEALILENLGPQGGGP